jgi:hypothetical protein
MSITHVATPESKATDTRATGSVALIGLYQGRVVVSKNKLVQSAVGVTDTLVRAHHWYREGSETAVGA